jgi:hypothetical protein
MDKKQVVGGGNLINDIDKINNCRWDGIFRMQQNTRAITQKVHQLLQKRGRRIKKY